MFNVTSTLYLSGKLIGLNYYYYCYVQQPMFDLKLIITLINRRSLGCRQEAYNL